MQELMEFNGNWHLFLDNHVIARSTGFRRVLHHPRVLGVVIPADKPWETFGVQLRYVGRRSDGTFIAFYDSMWWDCDGGAKQKGGNWQMDRAHHMFSDIAYATSKDGIHWEKPVLGRINAPSGIDWEKNSPFPSPIGSSKSNNLGVPFNFVCDMGSYGNVKDPSRRFAINMVPEHKDVLGMGEQFDKGAHGYFAAEVPDFINDPDWKSKLTDSGSNFNPRRHLLHYWDNINNEWVAIDQGVIGHWFPSREIARFASKDLNNWTSDSVLYPDCDDPTYPEYYDEPMSMLPFCAEGMVLGLLSWFHSDRTHPHGGPIFETSSEHLVRWPWVRKGTNEMRITISRDGGKTWDRTVSREAWVPHGTEEDSCDRLVIMSVPPLRVGDEDWFYMDLINGNHLIIRNNLTQDPYYHNRTPKHQVGLYVQKHNRYVSLKAGNNQEILITKPVTVDGSSLQLNVDASRGEVRVGIGLADPVLTFDGTTPSTAPHLLIPTSFGESKLISGFTFEECEPIFTNDIEYTVKFKDGKTLDSLKGKTVWLFIQMYDADLYGFRFI